MAIITQVELQNLKHLITKAAQDSLNAKQKLVTFLN